MLSSSYPILYIYGFWVVFKQPINNICMAMINRFMQQSVPILILRYSLNEIVNVAQFLFIRYECLVKLQPNMIFVIIRYAPASSLSDGLELL